ncbi:hypothetical protein ACFWVC_29960 [Streptomyces sp. NPDC058691]|uniref:hypothetical protein n=1 Tax=Streptomyces sp. NPDC058691 TaxID=3346601 RepID=UPI0036599A68
MCAAAMVRRPAALVLAIGVALAAPVLTPARTASAAPARAAAVAAVTASTADDVKYYVVKSSQQNDGQVETLLAIAERTLGDGNRFSEILDLNTGRRLPDGFPFTRPEQLVPGFALRLPDDATGDGVQVGPLPEATVAAATGGASAPLTIAGTASFRSGFPIGPLVGGGAGLALLTVLIIARRTLARFARRIGTALWRAARVLRPRLPRAAQRALRRRRRAALGRSLVTDTHTLPVVRHTLREVLATPGSGPGTGPGPGPGSPPTRVYSVLALPTKVLAAVSATGPAPERWTALEPTRWERTGVPASVEDGGPDDGLPLPLLARVGVSERGHGQFLVDLGQLNGTLSILGDLRVARDTLAALVRSLLDSARQDNAEVTVVAVDPARTVLPDLHAQHGLLRVPGLQDVSGGSRSPLAVPAPEVGAGLIRSATRTAPVTGILVLAQPPAEKDLPALTRLSSRDGGWIVLATGDVPGAHWRWQAEEDGTVDTGILGHRVFVPAQTVPVPAGTG